MGNKVGEGLPLFVRQKSKGLFLVAADDLRPSSERELSASFSFPLLDAFPGAWLAWLSLSVDGGGRASARDPRWSQELSMLPGRLTAPCTSIRGKRVCENMGLGRLGTGDMEQRSGESVSL
jgi:hypothetical protein